MIVIASILWRRLDAPGHDACHLEQLNDGGWRLIGAAAFRHEDGTPAQLSYEIACDAGWVTQSGRVRGMAGTRHIDFRVQRRAGTWLLNDAAVPGMEHLTDLDLGFTPATNLVQIRRLAMPPNAWREQEPVSLPAAWLDVDSDTLSELPQTYAWRGGNRFRYEAPRFGYAAELELAPSGFVARYPGLWEAEAAQD